MRNGREGVDIIAVVGVRYTMPSNVAPVGSCIQRGVKYYNLQVIGDKVLFISKCAWWLTELWTNFPDTIQDVGFIL